MVHRKNNIWLIEKEIFIIIIDSFVLFFFLEGSIRLSMRRSVQLFNVVRYSGAWTNGFVWSSFFVIDDTTEKVISYFSLFFFFL